MSLQRRSRSTLIVVLLIATLVLATALAYEAHQSARSHRATAESVLRDYAAFATWELSRLSRQQLLTVLGQQLQDVRRKVERDGIDGALNHTPCASGCGDAHTMKTVFATPLPGVNLAISGEPLPGHVHARVLAAIAEGLRVPREFTCPAMYVAIVDGSPLVVAWRPLRDATDKPVGVVGFTADPPFITHIFERLLKQHPLLPPSLAPRAGNPNGMLAVRVATPDGASLFASSREWSPYAGEQRFQKDMGSLELSVALRQEAAASLIIGGLPRERLPLVVGLLGLTAGLIVVALFQLRRDAELSRLRSDFVSGVSHELRTPLAQIRMFSETLLLGRVRSEHEGRRSLEIILREAQRLGQLVENVLLFARGERKTPRILPKPTPLAPLVSEIVDSFAPLATGANARLATALHQTAAANVDPGALRQILLNLLDNAVKYGPSGQTVSVALGLNGDRARILVEDEGPGIDARDAERIWQPFNRLSKAAAVTGGAGIGLSIVRQLAELHGGRAWVEAGSIGARFIVELPGAWVQSDSASAVA